MSKSETELQTALDKARAVAQFPITKPLAHAIIIGRDRLARVEYTSERCGRAWTLNKCRQAARSIEKALAFNNGGAA